MAITRDPGFPAEAAQLMATFSRCANGHNVDIVVEAAANMMAATIVQWGKRIGISTERFPAFADAVVKKISEIAVINFDRKPHPDDIPVEVN